MAPLKAIFSIFALCAVFNCYNGCPVKVTVDIKGSSNIDNGHADTTVYGVDLNHAIEELTNRTRHLETVLLQQTGPSCNVAFTARRVSRETLTETDTVVRFEDIYLNQGYGYSSVTGMFTAPSDGTYVFSCSITTAQHLATGARIVVDGNEVARIWSDARESDRIQDDSASGTVVVHLQSGSQVYVQLLPEFGSLFIEGDKWSVFAGWKLGCN